MPKGLFGSKEVNRPSQGITMPHIKLKAPSFRMKGPKSFRLGSRKKKKDPAKDGGSSESSSSLSVSSREKRQMAKMPTLIEANANRNTNNDYDYDYDHDYHHDFHEYDESQNASFMSPLSARYSQHHQQQQRHGGPGRMHAGRGGPSMHQGGRGGHAAPSDHLGRQSLQGIPQHHPIQSPQRVEFFGGPLGRGGGPAAGRGYPSPRGPQDAADLSTSLHSQRRRLAPPNHPSHPATAAYTDRFRNPNGPQHHQKSIPGRMGPSQDMLSQSMHGRYTGHAPSPHHHNQQRKQRPSGFSADQRNRSNSLHARQKQNQSGHPTRRAQSLISRVPDKQPPPRHSQMRPIHPNPNIRVFQPPQEIIFEVDETSHNSGLTRQMEEHHNMVPEKKPKKKKKKIPAKSKSSHLSDNHNHDLKKTSSKSKKKNKKSSRKSVLETPPSTRDLHQDVATEMYEQKIEPKSSSSSQLHNKSITSNRSLKKKKKKKTKLKQHKEYDRSSEDDNDRSVQSPDTNPAKSTVETSELDDDYLVQDYKTPSKSKTTKKKTPKTNRKVLKEDPVRKTSRKSSTIINEDSSDDDDSHDESDVGNQDDSDSNTSISEDLTIPDESDICFEDETHPGTVDFLDAVQSVLEEECDWEYCPKIYRGIKRRLKGRRFFVSIDGKRLDAWREVQKTELVDVVWNYFEEEKAKLEEELDQN